MTTIKFNRTISINKFQKSLVYCRSILFKISSLTSLLIIEIGTLFLKNNLDTDVIKIRAFFVVHENKLYFESDLVFIIKKLYYFEKLLINL